MKRFTIVLDGVADRPQKALSGRTPMEAASTPGLDRLYKSSKPGTVQTIPPGLEVGSSVANLNLLGYDPESVYRGRAVIEAAGAGLGVNRGDLYIRCNFITLEGDSYETSVMKSYSAHEIETDMASPLTDKLNREVFKPPFKLVHIDTFRNILIVEGAADIAEQLAFMPAHDMIGGRVADYIKGSPVMQEYFALMKRAYEVLKGGNGTDANGIWFWGASYAPSFGEQLKGRRVVLAETSLMRGIAALSGTECVTTSEDKGFVEFLKDKTKNALAAVRDYDYAYIHIQKPDDLSHELQPVEKMRAIEHIDTYFIQPFFAEVSEPYSAVIVSDHYTFSDTGSHGGEPSPFMLLGQGSARPAGRFTEQDCRNTGWSIKAGELVALQGNGGKR
jgi:2,3-bisphosphoglycerate-independent phosphoglycerate mutase